jgi:hypothetical protein
MPGISSRKDILVLFSLQAGSFAEDAFLLIVFTFYFPLLTRAVKFSASVRGEPVEPHQKSALRQAQGERYDPDIPENLTALPLLTTCYCLSFAQIRLLIG